MKETKMISFGVGEVSPQILLETDTNRYTNFMEFNIGRSFHNFSPTNKPYPLSKDGVIIVNTDTIDRTRLENDLKNSFHEDSRKVGNITQYKDGYIVVGINVNDDSYEILKRFRYTDTLSDSLISDPNYKVPNILNGLETDINYMIDKKYDFVQFFILGDGLDYYNGHREFIKQDNPSQKVIKELDGGTKAGLFPLRFLNKFDTSLNVRGLERDCYNLKYSGNRPMSRPANYYIIYYGKISTKDTKLCEELYSYNIRERNLGNINIITNFNTNDLVETSNIPIDPIIKDSYNICATEIEMKKNGWEIIHGVDVNIPLNIHKHTFSKDFNISKENDFYGNVRNVSTLMTNNKIEPGKPQIVINDSTMLSEI